MDHKEAIDILIKLLDNHSLNAQEEEAIKTAVGVLSWTSLAKSRVKAIKDKRDRKKP